MRNSQNASSFLPFAHIHLSREAPKHLVLGWIMSTFDFVWENGNMNLLGFLNIPEIWYIPYEYS